MSGEIVDFKFNDWGEMQGIIDNPQVGDSETLEMEECIYLKKPLKRDVTCGGDYPDAWPLKRIKITVEEIPVPK